MMQTGILLALASAGLFGASTPFAKHLLGSVDPWMMAGLLYLGAGLGLAAVHLSRTALRLPAVEAPLRRADMPWLALVTVAGGLLAPLLLMFGLSFTDAASASLLLNLEGLATMGIAWLVFRENVDRRLLLGAFAILSGAVLLSWEGRMSLQWGSLQWGALLIAGACLCWGLFLPRAVRGRGARGRHARRGDFGAVGGRRVPDGGRPLAASVRAARAPPCP